MIIPNEVLNEIECRADSIKDDIAYELKHYGVSDLSDECTQELKLWEYLDKLGKIPIELTSLPLEHLRTLTNMFIDRVLEEPKFYGTTFNKCIKTASVWCGLYVPYVYDEHHICFREDFTLNKKKYIWIGNK
jgi:hypothetical protein